MTNTLVQIREFFSTPDKPVKAREMMDYWSSLSKEEQEEHKHADLS